jgi:threonine synthase
MAAALGHSSVIFAPKAAPPAKIAQLLIYGAKVILVDGNYDAAFDLSVEAAQAFGWYCRNTGYNPFTAEGKKTAAFEIWEQCKNMGRDVSTVNVFVSVGDGNIISGIHKGFKDLVELELIEKSPRIFGIQSDESAAIANAFKQNTEDIQPVAATTRADSISVDMPRDGLRALRAATQTGGAYLTVSDQEIIAAIADLGAVGIFAEPAGSTSYAGLQKAVREGLVDPQDPIMVINTGSGLKDVSAAMLSAGEAPVIEPTLAAVKKLV